MCRFFFYTWIEFDSAECLFDTGKDSLEDAPFLLLSEQLARFFLRDQVLPKLSDRFSGFIFRNPVEDFPLKLFCCQLAGVVLMQDEPRAGILGNDGQQAGRFGCRQRLR